MDITKEIKRILFEKDLNTVELARRLGCGTANIYNKYKRNNFSVKELQEIADALGCDLKITFTDRDTGRDF